MHRRLRFDIPLSGPNLSTRGALMLRQSKVGRRPPTERVRLIFRAIMAAVAVPFGLVKTLQARSGLDVKTCKAALTEADGDIDAAVAALGVENTEPGPSVTRRSPDESGGGVTVLQVEAGDGATYPRPGDTLKIHYRGTLCSDGTEFDSSYARDRPFCFKFGTGDVISGWDVGLARVSLGERAVLTVSSESAYGAAGAPGKIPPHADLRFEVHLLGVNTAGVSSRDTPGPAPS